MGQQIKLGNGTDVITYLKSQHQQVKALFGKVISAEGKQREEAFFDLRRLMAIHETAEEEIVHPAATRAIPGGEAIVAARLKEEKKAKVALTELEALDVDSDEFDEKIEALQKDVLAHAKSEETEEFAQLATALDETRLKKMAKAVEIAESIAPTRAHPGIESAAGNMFAGPFASMVDRTRDALSGKH